MKSLRAGALVVALAMTAGAAQARDYGWHGGHGNWHPRPTPTPTPAPTVQRSSGSTRSYSAYYRDGGSGYGWLSGQWSGNNSNGYNGTSTYIDTPHRGDWYAKVEAQRRWDNEQYQKMQQEDASNARCGLSNAPAYCYRLKGPYPQEMRVVRY